MSALETCTLHQEHRFHCVLEVYHIFLPISMHHCTPTRVCCSAAIILRFQQGTLCTISKLSVTWVNATRRRSNVYMREILVFLLFVQVSSSCPWFLFTVARSNRLYDDDVIRDVNGRLAVIFTIAMKCSASELRSRELEGNERRKGKKDRKGLECRATCNIPLQ